MCGSWTACRWVEWGLLIRWSGEFRARGLGWECFRGVVVWCVCDWEFGRERLKRGRKAWSGSPAPSPDRTCRSAWTPAGPPRTHQPPHPQQATISIFSLQVPLPSSTPRSVGERVKVNLNVSLDDSLGRIQESRLREASAATSSSPSCNLCNLFPWCISRLRPGFTPEVPTFFCRRVGGCGTERSD